MTHQPQVGLLLPRQHWGSLSQAPMTENSVWDANPQRQEPILGTSKVFGTRSVWIPIYFQVLM